MHMHMHTNGTWNTHQQTEHKTRIQIQTRIQKTQILYSTKLKHSNISD